MKRYLFALMSIPLCTFSAAHNSGIIRLTDDPKITIGQMAISSDGSLAAYTICKERPLLALPWLFSAKSMSRSYICLSEASRDSSADLHELLIVNVAGRTQRRYPLASEPEKLVFSPDNTLLAISLCATKIPPKPRCLSLFTVDGCKKTKNIACCIKARDDPSRKFNAGGIDIAFSHNGKHTLYADHWCGKPTSHLNSIAHYDLATDTPRLLYADLKPFSTIGHCIFNQSNDAICAAQVGKTIKLWDLREHAHKYRSYKIGSQTKQALGFSPDGSTLFTSTQTLTKSSAVMIHLLSMATGTAYHTSRFDYDTGTKQKSSEGNTFDVTIPGLKALRAHYQLTNRIPYTRGCASSDEHVLLTMNGKNLLLAIAEKKISQEKKIVDLERESIE